MGLLSTIGAASARAYGFTRSAVAAVKDTYFNLTTLLLNTSSTNGAQNNTFIDSSSNNFTITRNGNTTQGTFTPFSQTGWGNYFNGSTDYLLTALTGKSLGTGSFTVECWIYLTSTSISQALISSTRTTGGSDGTSLMVNSQKISISTSGSFLYTGTATLNANQWYHVAYVRNGSSACSVYINGSLDGTFTDSRNFSGTQLLIGGGEGGNGYFPGYISNYRITNTAVYTTTFTPSTSALTAISGSAILTCQSSRFVDNSGNNFTFTIGGTPSVQAFSPFAPTAAYSTTTVGGSGYFDGSGDYLNFATGTNLPGSGQFTYEFWVYTSNTALSTCFSYGGSGGNLRCFVSSGGIQLWNGATQLTAGNTALVKYNAWNHVVVQRDASNNLTSYINGVRDYFTSRTDNFNAGQLFLGAEAGSNPLTGYIAGFKYTASSAVYSGSTITVPTSPPSSSGSTICVNFTNAGIYDATAKNDIETVGNAQVSTTQAKFGTTSMYFDGSGDYLQVTSNSLFDLKTSDFTVEFFIYPTSFSVATYPLYSQFNRSTTNAFAIEIGTSGAVNVYVTNSGGAAWSIINAGNIGTLTLNTWNHVAFVRNGSAFRGYVNGTQGSLSTNSSNTIEAFNGFNIGSTGAGSSGYFTGYMDEYRITRYARYTSSFTPATTAFPVQ